jgi:hypothetical protein
MAPTLSGGLTLKGTLTIRAYERGSLCYVLESPVHPLLTVVARPAELRQFLATGLWRVREAVGKLVREETRDNLITNAALAYIASALVDAGATYDTGLAYVAIGTGITTPANGDTTLVTEYGRKAITSMSAAGGTVTLDAFFPSADCTVAIKEVGVFAGLAASSVAGSGILFDRALFDYNNTGGDDLTITGTFSVGRA